MLGTGWGAGAVMRPLQATEVQVNWCCHLLHTPWHTDRNREKKEGGLRGGKGEDKL